MKPSEILAEAKAIHAQLQDMLLAEIPKPENCVLDCRWWVVSEYADFQVKLLGKVQINGSEHEFSYGLPMDASREDLSRVYELFVRDFILKSGIRDDLAKAVTDARIFPLKKGIPA